MNTIETPEATTAPVEVVDETPNLDTMERGDSLAIWNGYKSDFDALKSSIEIVLASDPALPATAKIARANRLEARKIRIAIEAKRKELGDGHLRTIQAINKEAKTLKDWIEPYEAQLQAIEDHSERVEAERIAALVKSRTEAYVPFAPAGMPLPDFAVYTEEQFAALLEGAKMVHEAKLEQARKIEAERIAKEKAEAEERERIRVENERLKKEAAEKESALAAERAKVEAEKKAAEETAREEREAIEAKARAEREAAEAKARADREAAEAKAEAARKEAARIAQIEADRLKAIADKERKEREAAEAQIAAQKAKEEKERKAKELAAKKAAGAPDAEKLRALAVAIRAITIPNMATDDGQKIVAAIHSERETFARRIETAAGEL